MTERSSDFWNLDLTKLTWTGWLLILVTVATVLGIAVALVGLLELFGLRRDPVSNRDNRWLGLLALAPAIAAGSGVFLLGRRMFDRLGLPILRSNPDRGE